jgi:hypothetical protein
MELQIKIRDQEGLKPTAQNQEFTLSLPAAQLTVRELLRQRVLQEVAAYNAQRGEIFHGLVQPQDAERTLNGYRMPTRRALDGAEQVRRVEQAFERSGFILLVDNRQAAELDEWVTLRPDSQVTFLKLVPLVGG